MHAYGERDEVNENSAPPPKKKKTEHIFKIDVQLNKILNIKYRFKIIVRNNEFNTDVERWS